MSLYNKEIELIFIDVDISDFDEYNLYLTI